VLKRTTAFVALGLAVGMLGSFFVARMLSGLVFGIAPVDWVTFTGVPAILLLTAFFASVAPARRALRTDPVKALQYE
jgi:ABC-type antimicrobial peptide transport system permease subunit